MTGTWRKKLRQFFADNPEAPPPEPKAPPEEPWPRLFRSNWGTLMLLHQDGRVEYPEEQEAIRAGLRRDIAVLRPHNIARAEAGLEPLAEQKDIKPPGHGGITEWD